MTAIVSDPITLLAVGLAAVLGVSLVLLLVLRWLKQRAARSRMPRVAVWNIDQKRWEWSDREVRNSRPPQSSASTKPPRGAA